MQRCVSLNTKCKCYPSLSLQHQDVIMKRRAKVKGTICTRELAWRHKCEDHCPLNAPETDSEGQTLQLIHSSLVVLSQSPTSGAGRQKQTCRGCCLTWQDLPSMCNEGGRAVAISLPQSSSSCPDRGSSFTGNNWRVMEIWFKYYFISKRFQQHLLIFSTAQ